MRRSFFVLALACTIAGCGGGGSSSDPDGPGQPAPTTDPLKASLPAGPVAKVDLGVHFIDIAHQAAPGTELRDAYTDGRCGPAGQPCVILFPGEFVQLDADQTNAQGQECRWVADPAWTRDDPSAAISVRGSSRPFEFRFEAQKPGDVRVQATVDGVRSNELWLRVSSGPKPY
jgi:hypothetical protein